MKNSWSYNSVIEWTDKKRFFGMPISFTRYSLVSNNEWAKLCVKTGLLFTQEDEINIYRINDITLSSSLFDKIFGVGTITIRSTDDTNPVFNIVRVKNPAKVRAMLANKVEEEKLKKGFRIGEID